MLNIILVKNRHRHINLQHLASRKSKKFITFVEIWKRMADNLQQRIDRLKAKAALLTERYLVVARARRDAETRVAELEEQISRLTREAQLREAEIERLRVLSVLSPDHNDVEETRRLLSGLVREIDKCIAQLSL